jgi:hypothetical protein
MGILIYTNFTKKALGAYPTYWCPVFNQNINAKKGFFLGIDAYGHTWVKACIGGKLVEVQSKEKISLRAWSHIQSDYSPERFDTFCVKWANALV